MASPSIATRQTVGSVPLLRFRIFRRLLFRRLLFRRLLFRRTLFRRPLFRRPLFRRALFRRTLFRRTLFRRLLFRRLLFLLHLPIWLRFGGCLRPIGFGCLILGFRRLGSLYGALGVGHHFAEVEVQQILLPLLIRIQLALFLTQGFVFIRAVSP